MTVTRARSALQHQHCTRQQSSTEQQQKQSSWLQGGDKEKRKVSSRRKPLKTLDSNQKATASGSKEKRKASSPNIEYEVPANGAKNAISPIAVSPVSDVRTKRRIDNWSVGLRSVAIKLLFGIRFRSGKDLSNKWGPLPRESHTMYWPDDADSRINVSWL